MKSTGDSQFYLGVIFILLAGICFGSLGIFGKLFIATGLEIGHVLSLRFLFAATLLGAAFIGIKFIKGINLFAVSKKQLLICVLLGVLGYAVFSSFYFMSFKFLSVGISAMILFTFPIFVFLGSVLFFKHPFDKKVVIALSIAIFGLFLLLKDEFEVKNSLGVYAGLAAAISYAGYVILSDRFQKNIHPLTSSFYVMLSAGVTLAFIYRPEFHHFFGPDYSNLKLFVGLSVFGTIAPLSLFLAGLQRIPGPQASILVMIEPIIASILAYFVFSEAMSLGQIVGISLVVLADIIIVRLK